MMTQTRTGKALHRQKWVKALGGQRKNRLRHNGPRYRDTDYLSAGLVASCNRGRLPSYPSKETSCYSDLQAAIRGQGRPRARARPIAMKDSFAAAGHHIRRSGEIAAKMDLPRLYRFGARRTKGDVSLSARFVARYEFPARL